MKKNIAIIGFGRFGALLAGMLKPFGNVHVISSRDIKAPRVRQIGFEHLSGMDWIIPAVPISALENILKEINIYAKKGSLVMDVASVKVMPCGWMKKHIRKDIQIIGTHPMFGPDSAKNGTKGLQVVVCPLRQSDKTLKEVVAAFSKMGLKIIKTTPEDHDKQAAKCLAMVHFLGRALGEMGVKRQQITTLGFERLMAVNETVNNDTWQLFLDMQHYNPYTARTRQGLIKALLKIEKKIKK